MELPAELARLAWRKIDLALRDIPGVTEKNLWLPHVISAVLLTLLGIALVGYVFWWAARLWKERDGIMAIARHTVREAVRKRVLLVLFIFGLTIVACSNLLPTLGTARGRVMLVEEVCVRSVCLICMLVAIFLAAVAIPNDISDRTIYSLLTKPISRSALLIGKIIGFCALIGGIVVIMAIVSGAFIRYSAFRAAKASGEKNLICARRPWPAASYEREGMFRAQLEFDWVKGAGDGMAYWEFTGLDKQHLPPDWVGLGIAVSASSPDQSATMIPVSVSVVNPETGESQDSTEAFPHGTKIGKRKTIRFPRRLISAKGTLSVEMTATRGSDHIGTNKDSVVVYLTPGLFELNMAKLFFSFYLQACLIIVVAVMGSTFLTAPVSILLSFFVYLCGHLVAFMSDVAKLMAEPLIHGQSQTPQDMLDYILLFSGREKVREGTDVALRWIARTLPDFRHFDASHRFLNNLDVPWTWIGFGFVYMLVYAFACLAVARHMLSRREME